MNIIRYFVIALLALLATPALAEVDIYFEVPGGKVYLFPTCMPDGKNWCKCAMMDGESEPVFEDSMLCWEMENDRVVMKNHKHRFEFNADDMKIKAEDRTFDAPLPAYVQPSMLADASSSSLQQ